MARTTALALAALGLAACSGQSGRSDQATLPPAAAQGPVNPDADVTTYSCADGKPIVAGYPDHDTAVVTYKDHAYILKRASANAGARYTGYGLQWWVKGGRATLSTLIGDEVLASDPGMVCFPEDTTPAQAAATATSFTQEGSAKP